MMMAPPPGMWMRAMPSKTVPPACGIRRLDKGSTADGQGGETRQDESPHRFTSMMLVSCAHNEETEHFTPVNHEIFS
jgi:hypothetical protein